MTQALSSLNISPWQFLGVAVLTQVLLSSKADSIVGNTLSRLVEELKTGIKKTINDFPVIALTGAFTFFAHQCIPSSALHLSLSTIAGTEGSLKVALFVSGVFALKAALAPYLATVIKKEKPNASMGVSIDLEKEKTEVDLLNDGIVCNLFPLAVGVAGAYYSSIPLKLAQSALYTMVMMVAVRVIGKVLVSYVFEPHKKTFHYWHMWITSVPGWTLPTLEELEQQEAEKKQSSTKK